MLRKISNLSSIKNCFLAKRTFSFTGSNFQGSKNYSPNNLEKKFLVWTGKYKSINEIPNLISFETMERSRNKMRIRIANIMIVATIIGCIAMVISGKRAAERGETVSKLNAEWHRQYNEIKNDPSK